MILSLQRIFIAFLSLSLMAPPTFAIGLKHSRGQQVKVSVQDVWELPFAQIQPHCSNPQNLTNEIFYTLCAAHDFLDLAKKQSTFGNDQNFSATVSERLFLLAQEIAELSNANFNMVLYKLLEFYDQDPESRAAVTQLLKAIIEVVNPEIAREEYRNRIADFVQETTWYAITALVILRGRAFYKDHFVREKGWGNLPKWQGFKSKRPITIDKNKGKDGPDGQDQSGYATDNVASATPTIKALPPPYPGFLREAAKKSWQRIKNINPATRHLIGSIGIGATAPGMELIIDALSTKKMDAEGLLRGVRAQLICEKHYMLNKIKEDLEGGKIGSYDALLFTAYDLIEIAREANSFAEADQWLQNFRTEHNQIRNLDEPLEGHWQQLMTGEFTCERVSTEALTVISQDLLGKIKTTLEAFPEDVTRIKKLRAHEELYGGGKNGNP